MVAAPGEHDTPLQLYLRDPAVDAVRNLVSEIPLPQADPAELPAQPPGEMLQRLKGPICAVTLQKSE